MMIMTKNSLEADGITHAGTFHCDDVLAAAFLDIMYDKEMKICRVMELPKKIDKSKIIVFDMGGGKFDHHQKDGNGQRPNGVPYAASGLIWRKFGHEIIQTYSPSCKDIHTVWKEIDKMLVQGVDAIDNGTYKKDENQVVTAFNINSMISIFNPAWNAEKDSDEAFAEAVEFSEVIIKKLMDRIIAQVEASDEVEKAIEASQNHIMLLEKYVPWTRCVQKSINPKAKEIFFVVYPSNRGGYNWRGVKSVGNTLRKEVPSMWHGLSGKELQMITGVKTAIYCHPTGFIGGAATFEDTMKMVLLAMDSN